MGEGQVVRDRVPSVRWSGCVLILSWCKGYARGGASREQWADGLTVRAVEKQMTLGGWRYHRDKIAVIRASMREEDVS